MSVEEGCPDAVDNLSMQLNRNRGSSMGPFKPLGLRSLITINNLRR